LRLGDPSDVVRSTQRVLRAIGRSPSDRTPHPGQPTELAGDLIERVDRVRLILRLSQHPTPPAGVSKRADEQRRVRPPPPRRGRVGEVNPVPLCLLTRRVIDHRHRAALRRPARLTRRTQAAGAQLAGERRIRPVEAKRDNLVEQRRRPQMRVLDNRRRQYSTNGPNASSTAGARAPAARSPLR